MHGSQSLGPGFQVEPFLGVVYLSIYRSVCLSILLTLNTYIYIYTNIHMHTYIYIYIHIYIHTHIYKCMGYMRTKVKLFILTAIQNAYRVRSLAYSQYLSPGLAVASEQSPGRDPSQCFYYALVSAIVAWGTDMIVDRVTSRNIDHGSYSRNLSSNSVGSGSP